MMMAAAAAVVHAIASRPVAVQRQPQRPPHVGQPDSHSQRRYTRPGAVVTDDIRRSHDRRSRSRGPLTNDMIRHFLTSGPANEEPLTLVRRALLYIQDWRRRGVAKLENELQRLEELFARQVLALEGPELDEPYARLTGPVSREMLRRASTSSVVRLAAFGATGAGKSTLINALLQGIVMQTGGGHITARICVLRHSEKQHASIRVCRIVDNENELEPIGGSDEQADPSAYVSLADARPHEVQRRLTPFICRSHAPPASDAEQLKAWTSCVVVVSYPFDLLAAGLELIDLAGVANDDPNPYLFDARQRFLQTYRPHGILFCYSLAHWDLAERTAYKELQSHCEGGRMGVDPPDIFFANTKADEATLAHTKGFILRLEPDKLTELIIRAEETGRFQALLDMRLPFSFLPESLDACLNFAMVNACEFLEKPESKIFSSFMQRLVRWIMAVQVRRMTTAASTVQRAVNAFYTTLNIHKTRSENDIEAEREEALQALDAFRTQAREACIGVIESLPGQVAELARDERVKAALLQQAIAVQLEAFDGNRLIGETRKLARGAFIDKFTPYVEQELRAPMLRQLDQQLARQLRAQVKILLRRSKVLDSLNAAVAEILHVTSDKSKAQRISAAGMNGLVNELDLASYLSMPALLALVRSFLVDVIVPFLCGDKVDANFKVQCADLVIKHAEQMVQVQPIIEQFSAALDRLVSDIRSEVNRRCQQQFHAARRARHNDDEMVRIRLDFAKLLFAAIEVQGMMCQPQTITVQWEQIMGEGAVGRVLTGEWEGHNENDVEIQPLAIKVFRITEDGEAANHGMAVALSFYEEVHYAQRLSLTGDPIFACPLGVRRVSRPSGELYAAIIFPRFSCDLGSYIRIHDNMVTLRERLQWARQLCEGVAKMHRLGFLHRDIKPSNVLVVHDVRSHRILRLALADFDLTTGAVVAMTRVMTRAYAAPELFQSDVSYTTSADVYSLGKTLTNIGVDCPAVEHALRDDPTARPTAQQLADEMKRLIRDPGQERIAYGNPSSASSSSSLSSSPSAPSRSGSGMSEAAGEADADDLCRVCFPDGVYVPIDPSSFRLCDVCMSGGVGVRFGCGHAVCCFRDALALARQPQAQGCPICRRPITQLREANGREPTYLKAPTS